MPKRGAMTMGGAPLDPNNLGETLDVLEKAQVDQIAICPNLVGGVMSDAALIIRALAQLSDIEIKEAS